MSELALNGERVVSAQVTIPRFGAAVADVSLAAASTMPAAATLTLGKLAIKGTNARMASFAGASTMRFIGGAAGWRKEIKKRGYSHAQGVRLSTILNDAARDSGETIVVANDRVIGTSYVRERAPAERVLHLMVPRQWWVDVDGVTRLGARPSDKISTPFTVIQWSGGKGRFEIATENYEDWLPGRTFTAPTVPALQTISATELTADNNGKVRLVVLSGVDANEDRLLAEMRAIIRAEIGSLTYSKFWDYTVVAATSSTVDVEPADRNGVMPALADVPMMPDIMGEVVTPEIGSPCVIAFLDGSPTKPICVGIFGTPTLINIADGALGAARMGDTVVAGPFGGTITSGSGKVRIG